VGGILKHSRAISAFSNPTTNSYKRLVPGYEAPVNLAMSTGNRSASLRIPMYSDSPKSKRIEVRYPDPSCNPYLTFAAMLMAGLDGIENKIDPGEPLDKDIYALSPQEAEGIPVMPASLEEALEELEADHEFLLRGNVFTEDALETWVSYKRENSDAAEAASTRVRALLRSLITNPTTHPNTEAPSMLDGASLFLASIWVGARGRLGGGHRARTPCRPMVSPQSTPSDAFLDRDPCLVVIRCCGTSIRGRHGS
jgi:glutamine synthetase